MFQKCSVPSSSGSGILISTSAHLRFVTLHHHESMRRCSSSQSCGMWHCVFSTFWAIAVLQNISNYSTNDTASHPTVLGASAVLLRWPQVLQCESWNMFQLCSLNNLRLSIVTIAGLKLLNVPAHVEFHGVCSPQRVHHFQHRGRGPCREGQRQLCLPHGVHFNWVCDRAQLWADTSWRSAGLKGLWHCHAS